MNISRTIARLVFVALTMTLMAESALAQAFPSRPVRIIVPFPPGGAVDTLARVLAGRLSQKWNQPVVVDNRPGGAQIIGTQQVAIAQADGGTMLLATTGHAINATLYENLPYDPIKDFAAVTLAATAPNILVAHPSIAVKSLNELIAYAKVNPGKLNAGHPGVGTTMHLAMEILKAATNTDFLIVGYKGTAPALTALLAREVDFMFDAAASLPHVRSGKLKALAVTSPERAAILPEVPTLAEAGLPSLDILSWYGFLVPTATPQAIVQQLNRDVNEAVQEPHIRQRLATFGLEPAGKMEPADFDRFVKNEIARWGKVVHEFGAKAQ